MRVEAGGNIHTTRDGETLCTDIPLSPTQIDLVCAVIKRHGRTVADTAAVEITEATTVVEHFDQHATRHRSELPNGRQV